MLYWLLTLHNLTLFSCNSHIFNIYKNSFYLLYLQINNECINYKLIKLLWSTLSFNIYTPIYHPSYLFITLFIYSSFLFIYHYFHLKTFSSNIDYYYFKYYWFLINNGEFLRRTCNKEKVYSLFIYFYYLKKTLISN